MKKLLFCFLIALISGALHGQSHKGYDVLYDLEGREVVGVSPGLGYIPNVSGTVSVEIKVNRYGEVYLVTLEQNGTTLDDSKLFEVIFDDAFNTLFNQSGTAPVFQTGRIVYTFFRQGASDDELSDSLYVTKVDTLHALNLVIVTEEPVLPEDSQNDSLAVTSDNVERVQVQPELEETEEHLLFKKVPIDGLLETFVYKMKHSGFNYRGIHENVAVFDGNFAGVDNASVYVVSSNSGVWEVIVDFPGQETWHSMKNQYIYFKRSFTSKYFCSPQSIERFPAYVSEGSGTEFHAFQDETAVYQSVFIVPNGKIVLSVQPAKGAGGKMFLRLEYIDALNSSRTESAAMDDI